MQFIYEDGYTPLFRGSFQEKCTEWCLGDGEECECELPATMLVVHVVGNPITNIPSEAQYRVRIYHREDCRNGRKRHIENPNFLVLETVVDSTSQEEYRSTLRKFLHPMNRFDFVTNAKFRAKYNTEAFRNTIYEMLTDIAATDIKTDAFRQGTECAHIGKKKKKRN